MTWQKNILIPGQIPFAAFDEKDLLAFQNSSGEVKDGERKS